jgi:hypothetical protein
MISDGGGENAWLRTFLRREEDRYRHRRTFCEEEEKEEEEEGVPSYLFLKEYTDFGFLKRLLH